MYVAGLYGCSAAEAKPRVQKMLLSGGVRGRARSFKVGDWVGEP